MDPARAIILFGHGSRDPLWRLPMDAVAQRIRSQHPGTSVRCAFLELEQPDLASAAADLASAGARNITVVPMFLGVGRHVRDDLPVQMERLRARFPALAFDLQQAVGEDARLLDLLADIALGTGGHRPTDLPA